MLPNRVSKPGPLTYESGALPIALRGPAHVSHASQPSPSGVVRWRDVAGYFQCQGVLLTSKIVGQGPTLISVGVGGGCLDFFPRLSFLFLPLSGRQNSVSNSC